MVKITNTRFSDTTINVKPFEKKAKVDQEPRRVILPDEIWLKIMYFMNLKDLLSNFCLACKHFRCLSLDSKVIRNLDLININDEVKYNGAIQAIKRSDHLKQISIGLSKPYWKLLMNHALEKSSLRSLELNDQMLPNQKCSGYKEENEPAFTLIDLEKMVELGKQLETLRIRNIKMKPKDFNLIANLKFLKSLQIIDTSSIYEKSYVFTPKNIIALAKNCKYLETINIIFDQFKIYDAHNVISYAKAFEEFFHERKSTLKSFGLEGVYTSFDSNFLRSIPLCEKLEELTLMNCAFKSVSEIKSISSLKGLKKLVIINNALGHCLHYMDYSSLKYLIVKDTFLGIDDFARLSKKKFPFLERVYINAPGYSEQGFRNFLTNCSMLKSAQFRVKTKWYKRFKLDPKSAVSMMILLNAAIYKDVYLDFGSAITNNLEFALLQNGITESQSAMLGKYHAMKHDFDQWCKENNWWIDVLSQSQDSPSKWLKRSCNMQ